MSDHLLSYQTPRQPPCQPWAGAGAIRRRADSGLKCGPKLRARCPWASSVTRMLYHGNTRLVTLMVCVLAVLGPAICTGAARAQLADEPPSLIETVRAYELIEPWVREMDVPEDAAGPDVVGACVTLRYEGRVIGIGTIFGGGTRSLPDATRIAIASARDKLPVTRDAMFEERLRLASQQITISLEIAGPAIPFLAQEDADLINGFSPGIHGVALRMGDLAAAVYPGEMLWTSQDVPGALRRLIAGVTGDRSLALRPIPEVVEGGNMTILRFRTRQVAQLKPGEEARLIHRGGKVIQSAEIRSMQALRDWAEGVGGYLLSHRDEGVYLPINDTIRSAPSPIQRALRMYALVSYAGVTGDEDRSTRAIREASHEASVILKAWDDEVPIGAAVVSLLAVSLQSALLDETDRAFATERAITELVRLAGDIESVPVPERPMVAWALAKHARYDEARAIMPICRRAEHPGMLVGQMPWLGLAEIELVGSDGVPSATALREMRDMMWRLQIRRADTDAASADLIGGVVFTRALTKLPTWQVARPLAFMGPMLAEPRLTEPAELPSEMARMFDALRFLRQLSAGDHEGHMYAARGDWAWGVRPAPWDQTMPIEASSMTLICVCQTIEGLERLEARSTP